MSGFKYIHSQTCREKLPDLKLSWKVWIINHIELKYQPDIVVHPPFKKVREKNVRIQECLVNGGERFKIAGIHHIIHQLMFDVDPECCTGFRFEKLILLQTVIGRELPITDNCLFQPQPRLKKETFTRYIGDPCILYELQGGEKIGDEKIGRASCRERVWMSERGICEQRREER